MTVLLLSDARSIHTVRWANALTDSGCKIHLVYFPNHENVSGALDPRVGLHPLPFLDGRVHKLLNAWALHRIYRKIRPDVVNAHYASNYGTLMRTAHLRHTVLSVWGRDIYDIPYEGWRSMYVIRKNLKSAQLLASTSHCMAEQTRRILGRNVKVAITPFGVDLNRFTPPLSKKNTKEIVIGCIKTLEEKYGMKYLIQAVRLLIDHLSETGNSDVSSCIRCRIYGSGSQRKELEELITQLNLSDSVRLMGSVPHNQVPDVLSQMDIFCVASVLDSESFGVAAVEASAMALPVVVSDVDGFREVVEDKVTGLIVPRQDPAAMAHALEQLVLNPNLRTELGVQGRRRVEALYNWEDNVKQMLQVYDSASKGEHK